MHAHGSRFKESVLNKAILLGNRHRDGTEIGLSRMFGA